MRKDLDRPLDRRVRVYPVVLDADQTGLDVVSWVGEDPKGLVVLAGEALPAHIGSLLHKAGVEVVRKPVDPEELLAAVGRSLR